MVNVPNKESLIVLVVHNDFVITKKQHGKREDDTGYDIGKKKQEIVFKKEEYLGYRLDIKYKYPSSR